MQPGRSSEAGRRVEFCIHPGRDRCRVHPAEERAARLPFPDDSARSDSALCIRSEFAEAIPRRTGSALTGTRI